MLAEGVFQCQHTSDPSGQIYTPNIPDSFFNHENAANYRATNNEDTLDKEFTYIYTIPAESAERDCRGIAIAMEYCYTTSINSKRLRINVFNFLVLTQDGQQFTINNRLRIRSTPRSTICTTVKTQMQHSHGINAELVCCDRTNIGTSRRFEVTESPVTIGVLGRTAAQVLTVPIESGDDIHQVRLSNSGIIGLTFTATSSDLRALPMLKLLLDLDLVSTSEPTMAETALPVSESTTLNSSITSFADDLATNGES